MCLRIRGKLFLVVSYHVFGKENVAVSMLWLQVIAQAHPGFGVVVLMGSQEGWLLLSLQVLFQRDRLMEVELKFLFWEALQTSCAIAES